MRRTIKYYKIIWLKHDLPAGLSVFLVALPLCLGIALASGAPLYSGLLSGIIGGMIVPLISSSQLSVSGPAAGLSTLVAASINSLGDYKIFLLVVVIAGGFQILLGLLKLGVVANYFPSSVIKGMLAAIGIILILKQITLAIGYDQPDFWTSGFLSLFSSDQFLGNIQNFYNHSTRAAVFISVSCILLLIGFQRPLFKKWRIIPAVLVVVIIGTVLNEILKTYLNVHALKQTQLVSIQQSVFESITFPDFSLMFTKVQIWKDGILIGLLASLETLLSIEAIDKLDQRNRITPINRELLAQGIGNIVCGCLGALPITAVIVRGAANVNAGARTKMAAFTHGLFIFLAILIVPFLLNKIPYAALSAILLVTGLNLTKPKLYRNMWNLGWKQFIPFIITILVILATDLLIGVSIGLLLSIYFIIQNNFKAEYKISNKTINGIKTEYIKLNTNVTFLNKVKLRQALDEVPEYSVLTIDGNDCNFIDYDILEIISEFENKAHDRHIEMHLIGIEKVSITSFH